MNYLLAYLISKTQYYLALIFENHTATIGFDCDQLIKDLIIFHSILPKPVYKIRRKYSYTRKTVRL